MFTETSTTNAHSMAIEGLRNQWNGVAKGWSDSSSVIRPWLGEATQAMIEMAGITSGSRVLDVAAGAGDQSIDIAERVGPAGSVLATDLSPDILRFAEQRAKEAGYANIGTLAANAENLPFSAEFDAAVSRLGLMLFPDPSQGMRSIAQAVKPGGGVCVMVFGSPAANPCLPILMATASRHAGLPPRDPFQAGGLLSLGKAELIDNIFAQAGLRNVATTKLSAPLRLPSVKTYIGFVKSAAGPIVQMLQGLDPARREDAWYDIEHQLERFTISNGWEAPHELLLTAARR